MSGEGQSDSLTVFDFQEHPVRIVSKESEPWFCAADVCRVLGISNPSDATARLDADERMTLGNTEGQREGRGGAQFHAYVSESGLYALVFKSRKPEAKAFRKWVTAEVLPAIRKQGRYVAPTVEAEMELVHYRALHECRHLKNMCWDEAAAFAAFVRKQGQIRGLEVVRRPDQHLGSVRVWPEELLEESWRLWYHEKQASPKYKRRHDRTRAMLLK